MDPIKTLLDRQPPSSVTNLPADLCELYGGDLRFPITAQPYVIANFAATLDGVVSYKIPGKSGGGEITGHNEGDHFIMGLLRASADAVLVGAGTFNEVSPSHIWTAEDVWPQGRDLFRRIRAGRAVHPLNVIVSASGGLDLKGAAFHTPDVKTLVLTTAEGKERIQDACNRAACSVLIRAVGDSMRIAPAAIIHLLHREFGIRLLLHEGGPALLGQFVKELLIDELFLTIAPQIAGRDSTIDRPALVRDVAFSPGNAPWLKLLSVKHSCDHIFLRYRRNTQGKN
jgi:riboflavin biosynthesis pyrimidine reductase